MIFLIEKCMLYDEDLIELSNKSNIIFFENYKDLEILFENYNIYDKKFFIFSSVNVAKKIILKNGKLRKGIIFNQKYFEPSFYTQYVERDNLLNKNYLLLPFGQLIYHKDKLFSYFETQKLFVKSNKNDRTSNPFILDHNNYYLEINNFKKTFKIYDEEIFLITEYKDISKIEKRIWFCDGEIVTEGFYSYKNFENLNDTRNYFDSFEIEKFVRKSVERFLDIENWFTVDICLYNEEPKIVELNAFSTSGFYEGINFTFLFEKIENSLYL